MKIYKILLVFTLLSSVILMTSCEKDDPTEPVANPVANFSFTGDNNFAPCNVSFTNSSTSSISYSWDFGDGKTSTLETPNHVYTNGGTFNTTLTVKNSEGTESVINKTITIKNSPTKMKVNSMILTGFPSTNSSGGGWDNNNGPDVYFKFIEDDTNTISTGYFSDILQSNLPLTFTTGFPITFSAFDFEFIIALYDRDSPDADDLMSAFYFTVRNHMPTNGDLYPTTINFQSSASELKFTLNVEWLE